MEFDFDAWTRLAKDDPQAFEYRRQDAIRSTIDSASVEHRRRLEGIQFQLDLERERSSTPLGACVRMNTLMWSGFHRLRKELNRVSSSRDDVSPQARTSANVISIQDYRERHRSDRASG